MKKLATLKPGAFFFYGGVQWVVLESDEKIEMDVADDQHRMRDSGAVSGKQNTNS